MARLRYILNLFLITIMTLLALSCSTDNTVTGNSDRIIEKPQGTSNINTNDFQNWFESLSSHFYMPPFMFAWVLSHQGITEQMCFFAYLIGIDSDNIDDIVNPLTKSESTMYNFRDNYLDKSSKGESYIASYYVLSKFGIDNNLVNRYHKEHTQLLIKSISAAKKLQNGDNYNKIINKNTTEEIEFLVKKYREHPNHKEIDPVLDYLEADLKKYKDQTKAVIEADFK